MSLETAAGALDLDWRMPPLREVDVLGHRIAYYEKGEGPPVRFGRAAAAAIPGSQLVVLPGVGHIPSIEAPRDFVRILTDFAADRPVS